MKMTKFIYPLTLALAVTITGAGCKHTAPRTTPLPGVTEAPSGGPAATYTGNQPLPQAQPMTQDQQVQSTVPPVIPGQPIETSTNWDPNDPNLTADREALAANTVHFAFDSAVIKSSEDANVAAVAAYLTSNANDKLMVEGNCDERGTEEYNRSLGERRALALREALAAKSVDPQRIRTISYGKDKPVDPGHDEAAFAKNRRDDFVIYHPKAGT